MRLTHIALLSLMAATLAGCNETLDTATVDLSSVKDKVQHPLPDRILTQMKAKGMDRNSPIMIRIFKEEGVLEIWKAKTDNRFEKIVQYDICAWSGRLGPKVKEGDRQAPEGFYPLSPSNLNPNSQYYLAINTGFPNKYDRANVRNGTNLMIHGACSSSGCYSMTDQQILEIYAFARDAFKGGQQNVQLQALPFRMTAENMARHRNSKNLDFWKMLKVGYDNFEVTKRPPEVNVCEKKYVFNQQSDKGGFEPTAACPPMSTPPALQAALSSYEKTYDKDYAKALEKYDGMAWYDPTEAERKAVVADKRKGRELAYAPTGPALKAGKMVKLAELEELETRSQLAMASKTAKVQMTTASIPAGPAGAAAVPVLSPKSARSIAVASVAPAAANTTQSVATATMPAAAATVAAHQMPVPTAGQPAAVPVPMANPLAYAATPPTESADAAKKKPFWKFWTAE